MSEVIEATIAPEVVDLTEQTNGQIQPKAFHYELTDQNGVILSLTVVATSATLARHGISQQFRNVPCSWIGSSDILLQVNDNSVIDV